MRIALDAMGGDNAPASVVEGALLALSEIEGAVVLTGSEDDIKRHIESIAGSVPPGIEIVGSTEVIGMGEPIFRALRKGNSSMRVAARLVAMGEADAFVSMGNSGAFLAICVTTFGKVKGVDRPALGAIIPTLKGSSLLIDVGANVDSGPGNLLQFAVMGRALLRVSSGKTHLKIGLLSNGEEEIKGNEVTKRAHCLFRQYLPDYIGYVEGKDLLLGDVDVVVCDGFVGNIVLKMGEGFVELLPRFLMKKILDAGEGGRLASPESLLVSLDAYERVLRDNFDYKEYGGAPLLGVKAVCVLGHGRSNSRAVKNAICVADKFARRRLVEEIEEEISEAGIL